MANIPTELCKIIIDGYYRQPQTNSTIQSCMRILMTRATTDDEKHQTVLLQYGPIFDWNTTAVTNMHGLCGYPNFNEPIDDWDVSNVTDMRFMFSGAKSFNQPLNNWNVSNVKDMRIMFQIVESFNQPLDKFESGMLAM